MAVSRASRCAAGCWYALELDLLALAGWIVLSMRPRERAAPDSDLGARLVVALQQALRERRLDVADVLLQAIEIYGVDERTVSGYLLVADMVSDGPRPVSKGPSHAA